MFRLSDTALDPQRLQGALIEAHAGACVTFEGWVRDHNEGKRVLRLEYEAYPALANSEGARIVKEAVARFDLDHAACVHRVGALEIGAVAVWVGVSAAHRGEAFEACRYIIDEVKHRVPIWKKEHYTDGDSGWVNCERCATHAHTREVEAPAEPVGSSPHPNPLPPGEGTGREGEAPAEPVREREPVHPHTAGP